MRFRDFFAIISCSALAAYGVHAQTMGGGGIDLSLYALKSEVPQPLPSVPPGPNAAGAVGSGLVYVPGNAAQRQAVQRAVANTDASGNFSITWATNFISSTPTVTVTAGNPSGTNGIICNWQTRNASGVTGKCWQTNTSLIALLGITITVAPTTPATNTPISVIMAEPTQ